MIRDRVREPHYANEAVPIFECVQNVQPLRSVQIVQNVKTLRERRIKPAIFIGSNCVESDSGMADKRISLADAGKEIGTVV